MLAFISSGKNCFGTVDVKIKVYDRCKYEVESKEVCEINKTIVRWGVFNLNDFNPDEKRNIIHNDMVDKYDEYLKIWTKDNGNGSETAIFRNSHVDMFII